ncbi:uncharacterized protein ACO6RY_19664 [Pungitius sinensis]
MSSMGNRLEDSHTHNPEIQFRESQITASYDGGQYLSLWCLGGSQTHSGITTFPTGVWGTDCGPEVALGQDSISHLKMTIF